MGGPPNPSDTQGKDAKGQTSWFKGALQAADAATGSLLFQSIESETQKALEASAVKEDIKLVLQERKEDVRRYVKLCKDALDKYAGALKAQMPQYAVDALLSLNLLSNLVDAFMASIRQAEEQ